MSFVRSGGLGVLAAAVILLAAPPAFAEGAKVSAHDFAFTAIEGGPLPMSSYDFGGQEPGKEAEIKTFCEVNFGVDFPLTAKEQVVGAGAHPFYRWAEAELGAMARPRWNFHKYLIAADGSLAGWFATTTAPNATEVIAAIEAELAKAGRPGS